MNALQIMNKNSLAPTNIQYRCIMTFEKLHTHFDLTIKFDVDVDDEIFLTVQVDFRCLYIHFECFFVPLISALDGVMKW
jgi:hypothetical protein